MDAIRKTSLSAASLLRTVLLEDPEVSVRVKKVFPVAVDKADLPYIVLRRESMAQTPVKNAAEPADMTQVSVTCYTSDYTPGLELAEAVRYALDNMYAEDEGLIMRSCMLTDSEEAWEDDAYVQRLIFTIKI